MKSIHKKIILFFILAFSLNLAWEVSHSFLYDWSKLPLHNDIYFYIPKILYSTLGDLIFLTLIFAVISIKSGNLEWMNNPGKADYFKIIFLGLIIAIFIEVRAMLFQKWAYNELMPTIFGIGITPLIQLALTGIFILWMIKK